MRINADSVENALEIYRERVEEKHFINISKNAIKNKSEMFVDTDNGAKQVGYVITVKPYKGRKYNPAFVWVCVG